MLKWVYLVFLEIVSTFKYAYLDVLLKSKYDWLHLHILRKNMKYLVVFVLMNTSKYIYVRFHRI